MAPSHDRRQPPAGPATNKRRLRSIGSFLGYTLVLAVLVGYFAWISAEMAEHGPVAGLPLVIGIAVGGLVGALSLVLGSWSGARDITEAQRDGWVLDGDLDLAGAGLLAERRTPDRADRRRGAAVADGRDDRRSVSRARALPVTGHRPSRVSQLTVRARPVRRLTGTGVLA